MKRHSRSSLWAQALRQCNPEVAYDPGADTEQQLRSLYAAFDPRDIDEVLAVMAEDVDWPNARERGRLHGREAVSDYRTRQWSEIDPTAEPVQITAGPDGRITVEVRQLVRSRVGETLSEGRVRHVYILRDGLVSRMDVEERSRLTRTRTWPKKRSMRSLFRPGSDRARRARPIASIL